MNTQMRVSDSRATSHILVHRCLRQDSANAEAKVFGQHIEVIAVEQPVLPRGHAHILSCFVPSGVHRIV
jgi:hypothetical protein